MCLIEIQNDLARFDKHATVFYGANLQMKSSWIKQRAIETRRIIYIDPSQENIYKIESFSCTDEEEYRKIISQGKTFKAIVWSLMNLNLLAIY